MVSAFERVFESAWPDAYLELAAWESHSSPA
jgi:hypothetical protein